MAIAIRSGAPTVNAVTGAVAPSVTLSGTSQPQTGDLLVIIHGNDFYTLANMPTPTVGGSTTGVTAVSGATADAGSSQGHVKAYYYIVTSTGNLTVTVAETGTADEEKVLAVYVLTGADITTVIDGTGGQGASASTTVSWTIAAVSPTTSNAYLIAHANSGGGVNATGITMPAGMTQTYNSTVGASMGYAGATTQLASSGSTGTKTFSPSGVTPYAGVMLAVLTASGTTYVEQAGNVWQRTPGRIAPTGIWTPGWDYSITVPSIVNVSDSTNPDLQHITADPTFSVGAPDTTNPALAHNAGDPTTSQSVTDTNPNNTHTTGDPSVSTTTTDTTNPALAHTTANPGASLANTDTNPALGHQTGDPVVSVAANDTTAPANTHQTQAPTPALSVPDVTAPAIGHQTFDATVSTTSLVNANAELTNHTVVAGDPSTSAAINADLTNHAQVAQDATGAIGSSAGAGSTSHTTGDPLAGVGATDPSGAANSHTTQAPAPALAVPAGDAATTHTTYDATISTAVILNVNAPDLVHTHTAGDPSSTLAVNTPAGATTHQTFDATVSTTQAAVDVTNPTNTHTTTQATAGVGYTAPSVNHSHITSDVTSTQTTLAELLSIAHSAFDATVTTRTQPPAFVGYDGSASGSGLDNPYATRATADSATSEASIAGDGALRISDRDSSSTATGIVS